MVGVCVTVIGLIRAVITVGRADTLADDFLDRERTAIPCAECIVWKKSPMESLSSQ
jgi:hypothetical protein